MSLTTFAPARAGCPLGTRAYSIVLAVAASLLWSPQAWSQPVVCGVDRGQIATALQRIRATVDPCGESAQVLDVLEQLARCPQPGYEICISTAVDRNVFDRPQRVSADPQRGTITWNPDLRTEIEGVGDGEPPVQRDPTASLLHELTHAAQECAGLNPGEHELEAVRIENIYRRAAGLEQRRGYGDLPLPPHMVRLCRAGDCGCSVPAVAPSAVDADQARVLQGSATRLRTGDRPD